MFNNCLFVKRLQFNIMKSKYPMKQIVCILLLMLSLTATAQSESNNKVYFSPDANVTYRLFKTQNIHIFIKLDTRNGKMTLVQFSASNANDMMQVKLNDTELASGIPSLLS